MIVIADTGPLNYLIRLGCSDVLSEIYGRVLVPKAVLQELQHSNSPPEVLKWAANPPQWLEEVQVKNLDISLARKLGLGEWEAISLAIEIHADVLLIDEQKGRQEAITRNISVNGTLFVLLQAALRGRLNLYEKLSRLQSLGFRSSPDLVSRTIARYEAEKEAE